MSFEELKQAESQYLMQTYGRFQVAFEKGQGATLWDVDGKAYIDLTSGIGVNCLGHNFQALSDAIADQAHKLMHVSNLYYTEPMIRAAEKLVKATGMRRVFFGNSGAEANEGMIKVARKYSYDKYGAGRDKIITLVNSFHGRTVTTLKATGQEHFHQYFFPFTEGFDYAEADNLEDLKAKADDKTCAVMMELIQGENKWSRNIKAQTARLTELTQNLLTLARAEEVPTQGSFAPVDFSALVAKTAQMFQTPMEQRGLTLETELDAALSVRGQEAQLGSLCSILFDNAVKYASEGSTLHLRLHATEKNCTLRLENRCDKLPPCPPERLFDRFYRADSARTQGQSGYGIGLSAAQVIVLQHRGRLAAEYPAEDRIAFTVTLPLAQ